MQVFFSYLEAAEVYSGIFLLERIYGQKRDSIVTTTAHDESTTSRKGVKRYAVSISGPAPGAGPVGLF